MFFVSKSTQWIGNWLGGCTERVERTKDSGFKLEGGNFRSDTGK